MEKTYTVALMTDWGCGVETCHPLAIGVDKATAKSIYRHFNKELVYNDLAQSGEYVKMVNREFCLNHADFEKEITLEDLFKAEEYDIFEPSAEDLAEWQMASCGLC